LLLKVKRQDAASTFASDTNHQKVLDLWKGGSRRPGAIFESVNRDRDIAIHHKIKV
jgi:hypothetical protein